MSYCGRVRESLSESRDAGWTWAEAWAVVLDEDPLDEFMGGYFIEGRDSEGNDFAEWFAALFRSAYEGRAFSRAKKATRLEPYDQPKETHCPQPPSRTPSVSAPIQNAQTDSEHAPHSTASVGTPVASQKPKKGRTTASPSQVPLAPAQRPSAVPTDGATGTDTSSFALTDGARTPNTDSSWLESSDGHCSKVNRSTTRTASETTTDPKTSNCGSEESATGSEPPTFTAPTVESPMYVERDIPVTPTVTRCRFGVHCDQPATHGRSGQFCAEHFAVLSPICEAFRQTEAARDPMRQRLAA